MPPSTIDVIVSRSNSLKGQHIDGGTITPTFGGRYRLGGLTHNFVYRTEDPSSCFKKYVEETLGLSLMDVEIVSPNWSAGELDMSPNVNPRFSKRGTAEVIVEYKRGGVTNWFEFNDSLDSPRLQHYLESIGLNVFDVSVTILTIPEPAEVDFLDFG